VGAFPGATVPDMAHGANREHSEGGQCAQSCPAPWVQEGASTGGVSWLLQWDPRIGAAQAMLVLKHRSATSTKRASVGPQCSTALQYLIRAP
jgi:hypothetical protein